MYKLKIRKIGKSLGVTLPEKALAHLKVQAGDTLVLTETPDGFKITPHDETFEAGMKAFEETRRKFGNAFRKLAE